MAKLPDGGVINFKYVPRSIYPFRFCGDLLNNAATSNSDAHLNAINDLSITGFNKFFFTFLNFSLDKPFIIVYKQSQRRLENIGGTHHDRTSRNYPNLLSINKVEDNRK